MFSGYITGDAVTQDNDEVLIYSGSGGAKTLIRREGQQAFDLPAGVVFGLFGDLNTSVYAFRAAHVNAKGDLLFRDGIRGTGVNNTNNAGIWLGNPADGFDLVMRTGSQMPGLPAGSNFDLPVDMELNDLGQFAFLTRSTIWATKLGGGLMLIAREGDQIDVDNGPGVDLRTIQRFYQIAEAANNDSGFMSLSSLGHVAFYAQLTDGTQGLFVSSAVAVPEPGGAALFGLMLLALFRRRGSYRVAQAASLCVHKIAQRTGWQPVPLVLRLVLAINLCARRRVFCYIRGDISGVHDEWQMHRTIRRLPN